MFTIRKSQDNYKLLSYLNEAILASAQCECEEFMLVQIWDRVMDVFKVVLVFIILSGLLFSAYRAYRAFQRVWSCGDREGDNTHL